MSQFFGSRLEQGGLWVQMPSGARIFSEFLLVFNIICKTVLLNEISISPKQELVMAKILKFRVLDMPFPTISA